MGTKFIETQELQPNYPIELKDVGIKDFKTLLTIKRKNNIYRYLATVELTINLTKQKKGAHLSRLARSITEILTDETHAHYSVEEMAIHTLNRLAERHVFQDGKMQIFFEYAHETTTPVSNLKSLEVYPITITTFKRNSTGFLHKITVSSLGNTSCPHALAVANGKRTHIQRAKASLTIESTTKHMPKFSTLIEILEASFSSPTFAILKTEDEQWVVNQMFKNPLFCEDVARNLLYRADEAFKDVPCNIFVEVVSEESIHKHDVISRGEIIRYPELHVC